MGLKRDWALGLFEITEEKGASRIRKRRVLKLPAIQPDAHIVLEKFDETSSCTGRPSALWHPSTLPFRDPPSDSILAFYVGASSRSGGKRAFLFSVFTSTLHSFFSTRRTTRVPWKWDIRPSTVPWDDWGPESTRWIDVEDSTMTRALSGTRCVISECSTGRMRMLDFNPERLSWIEDWIKRTTGETGGRDWQVMTSPTTIPAWGVFEYDIESKLPYYELRKTGVQAEIGSAFIIDDKWVVLIRVCSNYYNVANIRVISNLFRRIRISRDGQRDGDRISLMVILSNAVDSVLGSSTYCNVPRKRCISISFNQLYMKRENNECVRKACSSTSR